MEVHYLFLFCRRYKWFSWLTSPGGSHYRNLMQILRRIGFLAFVVFFAWGGAHRYLRTVSGLDWIEGGLYLAQAVLGMCGLVLLARRTLNKIDIAVLLILFVLFISYVRAGMSYGLYAQVQFPVKYVMPALFYFFIRYNYTLDAAKIDVVLHALFFVAFAFLIVEFVSIQILTVSIFNFATYWDEAGVEGYHASAVTYGIIDDQYRRPWGFMAMPQATGAAMAAFAIYFFVVHERVRRYILGFLGVCGIVITGSRTGILVFVSLIWATVFLGHRRSKVFVVLNVLVFLALSVLIIAVFLNFPDPGLVLDRFLLSVSGFMGYLFSFSFYDLSADRMVEPGFDWKTVMDLLFGQGVEGAGNQVLGLGEIHLLNNVLRIGLISTVLSGMAAFLLYRESIRNFRSMQPGRGKVLVSGFILFAVAILLGSLHYDVVARYPMSLAFVMVVGFLARSAKGIQRESRSRMNPNIETPKEASSVSW